MLKLASLHGNRTLLKNVEIFLYYNAQRTITSKHHGERKPKPKPFPYERWDFTGFHAMVDSTLKRLDENSRVIVIDGPPACGKSKLAKELADEFEMKYIEDPMVEVFYTSPTGYDLRLLDEKLPVDARSFDEEKFAQDPYHRHVAAMQIIKYKLRFQAYFDALAHLLNTGDGIVIERSPWSDKVFMEAMVSNAYMSKAAKDVYYDVVRHTIWLLLRPHLVIYLDVPPQQTLENLKKGENFERDAKAFTKKYLQNIDDQYKLYLKTVADHSKLLVYDWSEGGDTEVVMEDVEAIDDFDSHQHRLDPLLKDWRLDEDDLSEKRVLFSSDRHATMHYFNIVRTDAPELFMYGQDLEVRCKLYDKAPGMTFQEGYDPKVNKNVWLKSFTHMPKDPRA